jgi:hypothetical protein
MSVDTYYTLLSVPETAAQAEIKAAYRNLIKQVHPDRLATLSPYLRRIAEDKAKEMTEAYSVLSDVGKRRQYDRLLAEHRQQSGPVPPPPPQQAAPRQASQPHAGKPGYNWDPLKRWAATHPLAACFSGILTLVFVVSLLPDSNAPTSSQNKAVAAAASTVSAAEGLYSAYPCAATETISTIDHKTCKPTAKNPFDFKPRDVEVVKSKSSKPAAPQVSASLDSESADLAACIKSGACKALESPKLEPYNTPLKIPRKLPPYGTVDGDYADLEKRCAFLPDDNYRRCNFQPETIAKLNRGDRVRILSPLTRAENGTDIYKIRTQQGWEGWINSKYLLVEDTAQESVQVKPLARAFPVMWANDCSGDSKNCKPTSSKVWIIGNTLYESSEYVAPSLTMTVSCTTHNTGQEWYGSCTYKMTWSVQPLGLPTVCVVETTERVTEVSLTRIAGLSQRVDYSPLKATPRRCPIAGAEYVKFALVPVRTENR